MHASKELKKDNLSVVLPPSPDAHAPNTVQWQSAALCARVAVDVESHRATRKR